MSFGFGFGGMGGMGRMPTRFEEQYHCYSVAYADKSHLEVSKELTNSPTHSPQQGLVINSISNCFLFILQYGLILTQCDSNIPLLYVLYVSYPLTIDHHSLNRDSSTSAEIKFFSLHQHLTPLLAFK